LILLSTQSNNVKKNIELKAAMKVLIVGGTGYLGSKIAKEVNRAGHEVVALVRESSDASPLEQIGATIVRGDITDPRTLPLAFEGIDTAVTSAIGYVARKSGDSLDSVDNQGNRNVADAALKAGVKRLVFLSILTADRPKHIPHLYQKFLSEEYFQKIGLPFVALRPGAFLDQELERRKEGFSQGTLGTVVAPDVPLTYILADDVAHCAVAALTALGIEDERIDLGMDRPFTPGELAVELSRAMGHKIEPRLYSVSTGDADFDAFVAYMNTGQYVANVDKQAQFFGPPATLADSVRRWITSANLDRG
jgi:uncharacterized protein YbjT (DUF2867 family)